MTLKNLRQSLLLYALVDIKSYSVKSDQVFNCCAQFGCGSYLNLQTLNDHNSGDLVMLFGTQFLIDNE